MASKQNIRFPCGLHMTKSHLQFHSQRRRTGKMLVKKPFFEESVAVIHTMCPYRYATTYRGFCPVPSISPPDLSSITFTPHATLLWTNAGAGADAVSDWRERLFMLAAKRPRLTDPVARFWQGFAETLLTALCHMPNAADAVVQGIASDNAVQLIASLPPPAETRLSSWLHSAPPMLGGEYLCQDSLLALWRHLTDWCAMRVAMYPSLSAFLEAEAPPWRQVGRVSFHLAENKADSERPFAFMVTYTEGLSAEGKVRHLPLGHALTLYAGEKNHAVLIRLLSPVQAAAEKLAWVQHMVEGKEIFQPRAFTVKKAYQLLLDAPCLEECGISLRLPDWWKKRPRPAVKVRIGESAVPMFGLDALVDYDVRVALGDALLSAADMQMLLQGEEGLLQFKGQWIEVDKERLRQVLAHWKLSQQAVKEGSMTFAEAMRLLAGMPATHKGGDDSTDEADAQWQMVEAGSALRDTLAALRNPPEAESLPAGLTATLRPYQGKGFAWLRLMTGMGLGACLADDMGLGKTIQVLTLLLYYKEQAKQIAGSAPTSLLVIPASLLGNWRAEAEKFAPGLRLAFLHPAESEANELTAWLEQPTLLQDFDLVITSYAMLTRHADVLATLTWRLLILDEAQAVKNPNTKQTRAVQRIPAQARIALTGTPVENRLTDLWSLFNCINPGLLGTAKHFNTLVGALAQRESDQYGPLRRLTAPYILRRMKTDKSIISDLPDKTETQVYCRLSPTQARLYQQVVDALKESLASFPANEAQSIARKGLVVQSLMRLKQICNHPCQFTGQGDYAAKDSGKFQRLEELCAEMASRQERVLVFTQFQEIIAPLLAHLEGIFGRPGLALHGKTAVKKRQELVTAFQHPDGPPFFVLSLKAGGTGLNLTHASQVIHFDRWWNPAVEDQATDRAFRIGQKRAVMVHKCVVRGTLEERIDTMLHDKRRLADEILDGSGELNITSMDDDALLDMLRLDIHRASM